MGSAAVAVLFRSAVPDEGMAPQTVDVCLAVAHRISRSNGVSSEPREIFEGFGDVAWMLTAFVRAAALEQQERICPWIWMKSVNACADDTWFLWQQNSQ